MWLAAAVLGIGGLLVVMGCERIASAERIARANELTLARIGSDLSYIRQAIDDLKRRPNP